MINITSFGLGKYSKFLYSADTNSVRIKDVELLMFRELGIPKDNYYLLCNGRKLEEIDEVDRHSIIHVVPKILGGKGGFGSMLRAIGAQIEKTTNREACRDLSGRRLRDINEEQRLKNWIAQQADREREAADRKKKKLERLCREPKHDFKDDSYNQARSELAEKVNDSVEQGFKASGSKCSVAGNKRKESCLLNKSKAKKKKKLWIDAEDDDDDTSSEESESSETNETGSVHKATSLPTEPSTDLPLAVDLLKNKLDVIQD